MLCLVSAPSQWRHNEHGDVSNHQPHDCLLNRFLRHRWKKTSKLHATGLCEGNPPVTVEFPTLPFNDVIMSYKLTQSQNCLFQSVNSFARMMNSMPSAFDCIEGGKQIGWDWKRKDRSANCQINNSPSPASLLRSNIPVMLQFSWYNVAWRNVHYFGYNIFKCIFL